MSLQQLFLIRGPSFLCARVSMVTFSGEAPGQRKSSAVKIKTFCRSPINHSVCRCLSSIVGLHVNEQIETILNLGYRQAISGTHCSTSGDCRWNGAKNKLKYEPIRRSSLVIMESPVLAAMKCRASNNRTRLITLHNYRTLLLQFERAQKPSTLNGTSGVRYVIKLFSYSPRLHPSMHEMFIPHAHSLCLQKRQWTAPNWASRLKRNVSATRFGWIGWFERCLNRYLLSIILKAFDNKFKKKLLVH